MRQLQDILDKENYLRLVRSRGGSRVWVPKIGNPGHRDGRVYRKRDARIIKLRKKGKSVKALAKIFDLSLKRVYSIVKGKTRKRQAAFR
ncbi:MAG: hypothetical protein ACYC5N_02240 [Endomicrobiales bacterium]